MILKIVGYAEQVRQYYLLEDFKAHGWIAHQRYPTKGASASRRSPSFYRMDEAWSTTVILQTTMPLPKPEAE